MRLTERGKFALAIIFGFILPMILLLIAGIHANNAM